MVFNIPTMTPLSPETNVNQAAIDALLEQFPETEPDWLRPTQIARAIILDDATFPDRAIKLEALALALDLTPQQAESVLDSLLSALELLMDATAKPQEDVSVEQVQSAVASAWQEADQMRAEGE